MFNTSMRKDEPPAPVSDSLISVQSTFQMPNVQEGFTSDQDDSDFWLGQGGYAEELPQTNSQNAKSAEEGKSSRVNGGIVWAAITVTVLLGIVYYKKGKLL